MACPTPTRRPLTRARQLHLDVTAGLHLRRVRLHRGGPGGQDLRGRDVDEDRCHVARLGPRRQRVVEEVLDRVRGQLAQLGDAAVPGDAGGVANEAAEPGVVGVLVLDRGGRQHDGRPQPPDHAGEPDRVGGLGFQAGVTVELDQLQRRAQNRRRVPALQGALLGGAMGGRLAARADDHVDRAAGADLQGDDAAAAELDVVGMGAEGHQGRRLSSGVRHRLHRPARWCRGRRR